MSDRQIWLQDELEESNRELERAHQQLQAASEELQSINGELEIVNAELHSTREELQAINEELRARAVEFRDVSDFLESILVSLRGGLVVIDGDMRISVWNDRSAELWGIRPEEASGQHFLNLGIGLPVEELGPPIRAVLAGESERELVELGATNRRGREFRCQVSLTPLVDRQRTIRGVILVMEEIQNLIS